MLGKLQNFDIFTSSETVKLLQEHNLRHIDNFDVDVNGEDVTSPSVYVFILANPKSGNQQGQVLLKNVNIQHFRLKNYPNVQVQIYDFLDYSEKKNGYNYIQFLMKSHAEKSVAEKILVVSAGGDGTFMGVLEDLIEVGIDVCDPRIFFSVIPFGTGNDLSQVLGWGRFVPVREIETSERLETISRLTMERLQGATANFDVWEIAIDTFPGGNVTQAVSKEVKDEPRTTLRRKMSNYASLGLQGSVGTGFEKNRHRSRLRNVFEYTRQSWRTVLHGVPPLFQYLKRIEHNGKPVLGYFDETEDGEAVKTPMEEKANVFAPKTLSPNIRKMIKKNKITLVEIIMQNIPGIWGRKVDLWGKANNEGSIVAEPEGPTDPLNWTPQTAGDGKLELYGIDSVFDYFKKQTPWGRRNKLRRIGQFDSTIELLFQPNSEAKLMIDGEFYELKNCRSLQIRKLFSIKVIGPNDPAKSRVVHDELTSHGSANVFCHSSI